MNQKRPFKNLLIVMTDRHIGNLLVSLYAINSVQQQLQEGQTLCCVVDHNLLTLAQYLLPKVDFIPYALRGRSTPALKKATLLFALVRNLRSKKIDVAVDLYGHSESYYIARLSGATFISCFSCQPKLQAKYHWSHACTDLSPQHQLDYYLFPFSPLFDSLDRRPLKAPQLADVMRRVKSTLSDLGVLADKPLVVIHPGAGKAYKLWPISHWQQLIKRLQQADYQVLLIGAGIDRQQIDAILASDSVIAINGYQRLGLIETIHLGFIARIMIGNDSGPTHLLATTPATVISLFGPTDHQLWSPLSANAHILQSQQRCLDSCSRGHCQRDVSCLEALSPDQVYRDIQSQLGHL